MIELAALLRATLVGLVLQLVMFVAGHYVHWLALHLYLFGGMMISATAAYIYAMFTGHGWFASATAGAIAGGACGLGGIGLGVILGDVVPAFIATGTTIAVFVGAVGGLFGQIAAEMRRAGF